MQQRYLAVFVVAASLLAITSCGVIGGSTSSTHWAYATLSSLNQVVSFQVDNGSGSLTLKATSKTGTAPVAFALHPSNQYAYTANAGDNTISLYRVNLVTGALAEVLPRVASGRNPTALAIDAAGSVLLCVNSGSNSVSVYSISASTGVLTDTGSPAATGNAPQGITVSGNFVYVTNANSASVSAYTLASGVLTPVGAFPTGNGPFAVAADPAGKFLYVANMLDSTVSGFTIDAITGSLTPQVLQFVGTGTHPSSVTVDPSGKYLYVSNLSSNNVSGYTLDATTGVPTPIMSTTAGDSSPYVAGSAPVFVVADPSGKFIFVVNETSNNITGFKIDTTTGILTAAANSPTTAGTSPVSLVIMK